MGPRASQDLRSPSPIMAPGVYKYQIDTSYLLVCPFTLVENQKDQV